MAEVNDVFNLNLKTLESLHNTIERLNNCDDMISSGINHQGVEIDKGFMLNVKLGYLKNLLRWANVLLTNRDKFLEFSKRSGELSVDLIDTFSKDYPPKKKQQFVYNKETDLKIDNIILDICSALQETGIFKIKPQSPDKAVIN